MRVNISSLQESGCVEWDSFASNHGSECPYQLTAWRDIVTRSYFHGTHFFIATRAPAARSGVSVALDNETSTTESKTTAEGTVVGILPLVHIRHWLFGNSLVSMPFCDGGGVLARDDVVELMLVKHSLRTAEALHVPVIELRQYRPLSCAENEDFKSEALPSGQQVIRAVEGWRVLMANDEKKVRMFLDLPANPDALMRSFKAKLRNQIRKPMKDGLEMKIGGINLIDDFYEIFVTNMRDLGSPVHSKQFILQVLLNFPDRARIFIVYKQGIPMACSLTLGFNEVISNPWASSLRRYSHFAPNMLLYWAMLEYACQQGYQRFDFGRSTVDEGTYRFKEQWGARPAPLYWYRFVHDSHLATTLAAEKRSMRWAIECWKHLPIPITRVLGPMIRRYISL